MALTIYGSPRSRTMRILWTAEELGLDYQHVPVGWDDPWLKSDAFLRINPAGAIPAIVDDGFALAESLAINLYLCKRYGLGEFYPDDVHGEAKALSWSLWAQGHLEPWVQQDAQLGELREAVAGPAAPMIATAFSRLDAALDAGPWLLGDRFTVADLNVAAVLSPSRASRLDLDPYPRARGWLERCYGRPAALAVRQRFAAG
jgi:glutathione S-transferase